MGKVYIGRHGQTYTMQSQFSGFIKAFWRRIYSKRNEYGKELPSHLPVEFKVHMLTALATYPVGKVINNNLPGSEHLLELPENVTLDVGNKYRLVLIEEGE